MPSPDVSGEKKLTYSITTIDRDNPDSLISNTKTQSIELKINVKNINDLAFIDQSTILFELCVCFKTISKVNKYFK